MASMFVARTAVSSQQRLHVSEAERRGSRTDAIGILQLERTPRFNFHALSLHRAVSTMKHTSMCRRQMGTPGGDEHGVFSRFPQNLIPKKGVIPMKALVIAFAALSVAMGASAAQAGKYDGCHSLSVHGIWDCR